MTPYRIDASFKRPNFIRRTLSGFLIQKCSASKERGVEEREKITGSDMKVESRQGLKPLRITKNILNVDKTFCDLVLIREAMPTASCHVLTLLHFGEIYIDGSREFITCFADLLFAINVLWFQQ